MSLGKAKYMTVRVLEVKGGLRIGISVDSALDAEKLVSVYPKLKADVGDDETELYLPLTGGDK